MDSSIAFIRESSDVIGKPGSLRCGSPGALILAERRSGRKGAARRRPEASLPRRGRIFRAFAPIPRYNRLRHASILGLANKGETGLNLRIKALAIIGATMATLWLALGIILAVLNVQGFARLEHDDMDRQVCGPSGAFGPSWRG